MTKAPGRAPELSVDGFRATITLRRPAEHNRLDPDDLAVVRAHVERAVATPGVGVLVITGEGERTFCSGYTIDALLSALDDGFEDMVSALEACPLPTIAALNGGVYGGACDLAMACDWRIGVRGARMFVPAVKLGLHYYPTGLRRFVQRIGPAATKKIFMTGMPLADDEMLRVGFLQELVARDEFGAAVDRYVETLKGVSGGAAKSMKREIDRIARGDGDDTFGRKAWEESRRSDELRTRLAAMRGG
jgi:enoyl-CoA hydratase/carnithine racemase